MNPILRFFVATTIFFFPAATYGLSVPYQIGGTAIDFQDRSAIEGVEIAISGNAILSDALADVSSAAGFSRWEYEIVSFTINIAEYSISGSGKMWFSYNDGGLDMDGRTNLNTPWSLSDYNDEALFGPDLPNHFHLLRSPHVFNYDFAPDNIIDISLQRLPQPVPEPSGVVLLGLGLLLCAGIHLGKAERFAKKT